MNKKMPDDTTMKQRVEKINDSLLALGDLPADNNQPAYMIKREALEEAQEKMGEFWERYEKCKGGEMDKTFLGQLVGFELCWSILIQHGLVEPHDLHYMYVLPIRERCRESNRRHKARV